MLNRRTVLSSLAGVSLAAAAPRSRAASSDPQPFKIDIDANVLNWVSTRIRDARMPVLSRGTGATYGADAGWFADMLKHWRDGYDWRKQEAAMNRLPQFTAEVMGRHLHFVHVRHRRADAPALLLLHGWPYSF